MLARAMLQRMVYPNWSYYPRNERPPVWVDQVVAVFATAEPNISTLSQNGPNSDGVVKAVATGLTAMGFQVEAGKSKTQLIRRPVLFGENGKEAVAYEIDAFHDGLGIAVEVEAGRGAQSNAEYRDIIRASLILDAKYFVLVMPHQYRFKGSPKDGVLAYQNTRNLLDAMYASQRLRLPFHGVLLLGY